jgi:hypothetical protein
VGLSDSLLDQPPDCGEIGGDVLDQPGSLGDHVHVDQADIHARPLPEGAGESPQQPSDDGIVAQIEVTEELVRVEDGRDRPTTATWGSPGLQQDEARRIGGRTAHRLDNSAGGRLVAITRSEVRTLAGAASTSLDAEDESVLVEWQDESVGFLLGRTTGYPIRAAARRGLLARIEAAPISLRFLEVDIRRPAAQRSTLHRFA